MTSVLYDETFPSPRAINRGDRVTLNYETTTIDGGILETSRGRTPLSISVGDTAVVTGLNEALLGRHEGESFSVRMSPDHSFGRRRSDWLVSVPVSRLPDGVSVGDQVMVSSAGNRFPAWVQKLSEHQALVDANHPLADETTLVKIDILSVTPGDPERRDSSV